MPNPRVSLGIANACFFQPRRFNRVFFERFLELALTISTVLSGRHPTRGTPCGPARLVRFIYCEAAGRTESFRPALAKPASPEAARFGPGRLSAAWLSVG